MAQTYKAVSALPWPEQALILGVCKISWKDWLAPQKVIPEAKYRILEMAGECLSNKYLSLILSTLPLPSLDIILSGASGAGFHIVIRVGSCLLTLH